MRIRFTRRAFDDREQIFEYLAERSPSGAAGVMARIGESINRLPYHPNSGHRTDVADVRVVVVGRYSYKIFYRLREETIEILHIRHTSRSTSELE